MSYKAEVYRVFIASPGDVKELREIACEVIAKWNHMHSHSKKIVLLPVRWETHATPEMGKHPQKFVNDVLKSCDVLIGIFGRKIGTPTDTHPSGTVEEIEVHGQEGKRAMLYFSTGAIPRDADKEQLAKLEEYKKSIQGICIYWDFEGKDAFREKLRDDITKMIEDGALDKDLFSRIEKNKDRIHIDYTHDELLSLDDNQLTTVFTWIDDMGYLGNLVKKAAEKSRPDSVIKCGIDCFRGKNQTELNKLLEKLPDESKKKYVTYAMSEDIVAHKKYGKAWRDYLGK